MSAFAAVVGAVVGAAVFVVLVGLTAISAPPPTVTWVKLNPPFHDYVSYLPCLRTGWLPGVTCYPTESRSVGLGLGEQDPEAGEH